MTRRNKLWHDAFPERCIESLMPCQNALYNSSACLDVKGHKGLKFRDGLSGAEKCSA